VDRDYGVHHTCTAGKAIVGGDEAIVSVCDALIALHTESVKTQSVSHHDDCDCTALFSQSTSFITCRRISDHKLNTALS